MALRITFSHSVSLPIALVVDFPDADGTINFDSVRAAHEFAKKINPPQSRIEIDHRLHSPIFDQYDERILAVRNFMWSNQKINAIKEYRSLTGCGLKEAKDAIEEMLATGDWKFHHPIVS